MKKLYKQGMPNSKEFADFDYLQAAAAQDCTGLMPTAPASKIERENYEELYPVLPRIPVKNDIDYVED